jgi:hypothetical protein
MAVIEKSSKAKARQRTVAEEYKKWLKQNPKAGRRRRIKHLDALSDSAYLNELVKKDG